jgi:predicted DNA-binding transcriptional regulator AlpA
LSHQTEVIRALAERLDSDTLAAVLEQLLGTERQAIPPKPNFRSAELRQFLGVGRSTFYNMRRDGRIPPGDRISAGIEIWSREDAIAIKAKLVEEQRQRDQDQT